MAATSKLAGKEVRPLVAVAATTLAIALLHFTAPTEPTAWHWVHLFAQQMYYVPILMAASWLGLRGTIWTASAVSLLFFVHIRVDWSGATVAQAHQLVEIGSYWIAALVSSVLFGRIRRDVEKIREAHDETLITLVSSLDLREHQTSLHSQRVRDYALLLGERLGLTDGAERDSLAAGALLHDVGKIGIPDRILLKPGRLTDDELKEIRRHPELGAALIRRIGFLQSAEEIVLAHHEKFDGSGYPRGLAGDAIPFGARIFAVVDAFDAMTSARPYHAACSFQDAADQIVLGSGTHFDPLVVHRFLRIPLHVWAQVAAKYDTTLRDGALVPLGSLGRDAAKREVWSVLAVSGQSGGG